MSKPKKKTNDATVKLQLFSLQVEEKDLENIQLKVLKFPKALQKLMYQHPVAEEGISNWKGDVSKYYPFAQSTAFKLIGAIFPNVLYANNNLKEVKADEGYWIYYLDDIDLNKIKRLIIGWLKEEAIKRQFEYHIPEEEWVFETESFCLKDALSSNLKYRLIPAYYTYILSRSPFMVNSLEQELTFSRCHNPKQGSSLLSNVLLLKNKYPFAYEIELNLTDPIDSFCPCLNVQIKTKRFYYKPEALSTSRRSLYVYRKNRYYKDAEIVFNTLKVSCENKKIKVDDIASEFFMKQMKISLGDFLLMPQNYLPGKGDVIALLGINGNEGTDILTGAGIPERNELFELVAERLSPLKKRDLLEKVKGSGNKLKPKRANELSRELLLEQFGVEIKSKTKKIRTCPILLNDSSFNIGVFTDDDKAFEEIVVAIRIALYLKYQLSDYQFKNEAGLTVTIVRYSNGFTHQLETGNTLEKMDRFHQIKNEIVSLKDQLSACVIEIADYHKKSNPQLDTKQLTRASFMSEGLVTQFVLINNEDNSKLDAYLNAVYDLLTVSEFRDESLTTHLKEDVLLGLSSISTKNGQHRFAFTKINQYGTWIRLYPSKEWMPLTTALTSLDLKRLNESRVENLNQKKAIFKDWVAQTLTDVLNETKGITYCFINTNLRKQGFLDVVKNNKFQEAEHYFSQLLHISNFDRLRLIRVNSEAEVPFYYIRRLSDLSFKEYNGNSKELKKYLGVNRESGVFKGNSSTYYLVPRRNDLSMQTNLRFTKINSPRIAIRKQKVLEISIKGTQDEKELDRIACLTQELRNLSLTYNVETKYPLPIYILHYLSEYLLALDDMSDNK